MDNMQGDQNDKLWSTWQTIWARLDVEPAQAARTKLWLSGQTFAQAQKLDCTGYLARDWNRRVFFLVILGYLALEHVKSNSNEF